MDLLYDEIAGVKTSLEIVQLQIEGIRKPQLSQERAYEILELFDIIYDKFIEVGKNSKV